MDQPLDIGNVVQRRIGQSLCAPIGVILAALTSCANPAHVDGMVPRLIGEEIPAALDHGIVVGLVSGLQPTTNQLWGSTVGNEEFRSALVQTIDNAGLAAPSKDQARYRLDADLLEPLLIINNSFVGVSSTANYELTPLPYDTPYRMTITRSYSVLTNPIVVRSEALRLASEGSMRENIASFLVDIHAHFKHDQPRD